MEILKKNKLPLYYNGLTVKPNNKIPKIKFVRINKTRIKVKVNIKSFLSILLIICTQHYSYSNDVPKYWNYVHNAENHIVQGEYVEAVKFYDTAFTYLALPFQNDIHNQIQCAKKSKDYAKVKMQAIFLLENYNLNPKYLRKYKKYYQHLDFKKYSIQYKNQELVKFEFISDIDSLFVIDQKVRTTENYIQKPYIIREIDSLSFEFFKNKWLIGDNFEKINLKLIYDSPRSEVDLNLYILVRHWFQQNFRVQENFYKLVELGKFPPVVYADLVDVMNGNAIYKSEYGIFTTIKYGAKIKCIKRKKEDIDFINENRLKIGLPTFSDYQNNLKFFKKHRKYIYYSNNTFILTGNRALKKYFQTL